MEIYIIWITRFIVLVLEVVVVALILTQKESFKNNSPEIYLLFEIYIYLHLVVFGIIILVLLCFFFVIVGIYIAGEFI